MMAYRKQYHVGFAKERHKSRMKRINPKIAYYFDQKTLNRKMTLSSKINHEYEETVTQLETSLVENAEREITEGFLEHTER